MNAYRPHMHIVGALWGSSWLDLTADITTAAAGTWGADPDSIKASTTIATTTGTFEGATIPCNSFAWTTPANINDGFDEVARIPLPALPSLFPAYDPLVHGLQLDARLVADPTDASNVEPLIGGYFHAGAVDPAQVRTAGFERVTGGNVVGLLRLSSSSDAVGTTDVVAGTGRSLLTVLKLFDGATHGYVSLSALPVSGEAATTTQGSGGGTSERDATDAIGIALGNNAGVAGAVSGFKIGFRARLIRWPTSGRGMATPDALTGF